jgi:hypothetical protein
MPNLPDIPGKDLIAGTTKRARAIATGAGAGALAIGGVVAKRVLGGRGDGDEHETPRPSDAPRASGVDDGEVETAIADPGLAVKPKAAKPVAKPEAPEPKLPESPRPKETRPTKPKAPKAKPAKPKREPGDQRGGKDPHHALNNPVTDPDPTEYPDPFDKREDPRDPVDPDGLPFGDEPHPQTGAASTSEPPPAQDPEVGDRARPPQRENLDD